MIKYVSFNSVDEYGTHVNPAYPTTLVKTAAATANYSAEIREFLRAMPRDPALYYIVVNAMGTYEVWGYNKRGDAFPREGLSHISLQSDMGTPNDYGYKTFEYYAKLYRNHANKAPAPSFGPVLFSYYNPVMDRVELIVGINRVTAADLIEQIERGDVFAVSMGCNVRYDRCSICGNKAPTTDKYCEHLANYMGEVIDADTARRWSIQLGYPIAPGSAVFAFNDHPRFFDISYVKIGADATAFLMGKAASHKNGEPTSAMVGEASGVTDAVLNKLAIFGKAAAIGKSADIDKVVGPELAMPIPAADAIRRITRGTVEDMISRERQIPDQTLDTMASRYNPFALLNTMIQIGIQPKPAEVQRIMLVANGDTDLANLLSTNNTVFNPMTETQTWPIPNQFSDGAAADLADFIPGRSSHPLFIIQRLNHLLDKTASVLPNDYWFEQSPQSGSYILQSDPSPETEVKAKLSAIAAIYAGLKLVASGLPVGNAVDVFIKKPWMGTIIAGGTYKELLDRIRNTDGVSTVLTPTVTDAELDNSQLFKTASDVEAGFLQDYVYNPAAYVVSSYRPHSAGFIKAAGLRVDAMNPRQKMLARDLI